MTSIVREKRQPPESEAQRLPERHAWLHKLLKSWEVYPILLIAALLRLYRIDTTQFDSDQADILRMAYDAIHHGLLVATANVASIHIFNPPGIIYALMLPAVFSADPIWAAVMTALLAIASVLLTYVLVCRYYGRLAGTLAALLYAVTNLSVQYSRFIWNQNLLLIFVPLFIATLLWGVVERRKGWLGLALILLGILFQLHGSTILLAAALAVAFILALETVRWRDLIVGIIGLTILYAPYVVWEMTVHFHDISVLLFPSHQQSQIDAQAWSFYLQFLSPYQSPFTDTQSWLFPFIPYLAWVSNAMTVLIVVAGIFALYRVVRSQKSERSLQEQQSSQTEKRPYIRVLRELSSWWFELRASPWRCGLLVIVTWQVVPLLYLSRHAIALYPHYFIMLMPGPFILIGLLLAEGMKWVQRYERWGAIARSCICVCAALLIMVQLIASTTIVLDQVHGRYDDRTLSYPYYNDLRSLQNALVKVDQVAQHYHVHRAYLSTDMATESALGYLSQQMSTPVSLFSDECLVLPQPTEGPAIVLIGPYSYWDDLFITHFAAATLVAQSARLGGSPFKLYIVQARDIHMATHISFPQDFQLLDTQRLKSSNAETWAVLHWGVTRSANPGFRTTYTYKMTNASGNSTRKDSIRQCNFSSMQPGEQIITGFRLHGADLAAKSLPLTIQAYTLTPQILSPRKLSPLGIRFETFNYERSPMRLLQTVAPL